MSEFKQYRRLGFIEARPYVSGESMVNVSVSSEDTYAKSWDGGWIARNPLNHNDQWYINAEYFKRFFESVPVTTGGESTP